MTSKDSKYNNSNIQNLMDALQMQNNVSFKNTHSKQFSLFYQVVLISWETFPCILGNCFWVNTHIKIGNSPVFLKCFSLRKNITVYQLLDKNRITKN